MPGVLALGHLPLPRLMQRVHDLAEHVDLELPVRRVPDTYRSRAFVAGKPRRLPFEQATLATEAIHDLHLVRAARGGAQQPVAPRERLVVVASVHERDEGERRVAQPAESIVPVANAAELLGERRRRRRDDAAGGAVGERLEREQRTKHGLPEFAVVPALRRPVAPVLLGLAQRGGWVEEIRR